MLHQNKLLSQLGWGLTDNNRDSQITVLDKRGLCFFGGRQSGLLRLECVASALWSRWGPGVIVIAPLFSEAEQRKGTRRESDRGGLRPICRFLPKTLASILCSMRSVIWECTFCLHESSMHRGNLHKSPLLTRDQAGAPEALFSGTSPLFLPPLRLPLLLLHSLSSFFRPKHHTSVSQIGTTQNWRAYCSLCCFVIVRSHNRWQGSKMKASFSEHLEN